MSLYDDKQSMLFADMGRVFEFFSYEINPILERFVEAAKHLQEFDEYAFIYLNHKGEIKTILSEGLTLNVPIDDLELSDFYSEDSSMFLVNAIDNSTSNIIFQKNGSIKSYITIPLITQNEIIGLFMLGSKRENAFDSELQDLFFSLGSFFAVAVENIKHFERSDERLKVIISLQTAQQAIANAVDIDEILAKIADECLRIIGAECSAIYANKEEGWIRSVFRSSIPIIPPPESLKISELPVQIASALDSQDAVFIDETEELGSLKFSPRMNSIAIIPLRSNGAVNALIFLEFTRNESERVYLIKLFAGQIQILFSNAMLVKGLRNKTDELEETNKLVREYADSLQKSHDMLENRVKELSTLHDVSYALVSKTDLDDLLKFILDKACSVMRADKGSILLLEGDELKARCIRGNFGTTEIKFKIGEGIAGIVAKTGQAKIVENVLLDSKFKHFRNNASEREETILAVPLILNNKVIGVLNVDRELKFGVFTPDDERLLNSLASTAAEALTRAQHIRDLQNMNLETLEAFAMAVDTKDAYTHGHSRRVSYLAVQIANKLRLTQNEIEIIARAALLHDIGKIGISNAILFKPGRLTTEEYEIMKAHVIWGENILKPIKRMAEEANLVRHHHERWDGKGYPDGLKGEKIPIGAAIISVCDAFDTMTSDRPYRRATDKKNALDELQRYSGTQFNPLVVGAFMMIAGRSDFRFDVADVNLREEIIGS